VLCLADGRLRFGLEGEKEIKKCTNPCEEGKNTSSSSKRIFGITSPELRQISPKSSQ